MTAEDMTFEMALQRLSDRIYGMDESQKSLEYMAKAIGLAFGMDPNDVFLCALADAAIASQAPRDDWLAIYPDWCRQTGANV